MICMLWVWCGCTKNSIYVGVRAHTYKEIDRCIEIALRTSGRFTTISIGGRAGDGACGCVCHLLCRSQDCRLAALSSPQVPPINTHPPTHTRARAHTHTHTHTHTHSLTVHTPLTHAHTHTYSTCPKCSSRIESCPLCRSPVVSQFTIYQ